MALKDLIKNRDLVLQSADTGNTVVILNKNGYISKYKVILGDWSKFKKLSIDQNKFLNHVVHMENRIIDVFKKLKNRKIIYRKKYEDLFLLAQVIGLCMVVLKFISLLKIVFHLSLLFYQLEVHLHINYLIFFVRLLTLLTLNEYTVKDSFLFAEELLNYASNLVMASFDVESLFTNIPLQETIDLCVELSFNDKPDIDGFNIIDFHELLTVARFESLVLSH